VSATNPLLLARGPLLAPSRSPTCCGRCRRRIQLCQDGDDHRHPLAVIPDLPSSALSAAPLTLPHAAHGGEPTWAVTDAARPHLMTLHVVDRTGAEWVTTVMLARCDLSRYRG
jgi:hypothetical protein